MGTGATSVPVMLVPVMFALIIFAPVVPVPAMPVPAVSGPGAEASTILEAVMFEPCASGTVMLGADAGVPAVFVGGASACGACLACCSSRRCMSGSGACMVATPGMEPCACQNCFNSTSDSKLTPTRGTSTVVSPALAAKATRPASLGATTDILSRRGMPSMACRVSARGI